METFVLEGLTWALLLGASVYAGTISFGSLAEAALILARKRRARQTGRRRLAAACAR